MEKRLKNILTYALLSIFGLVMLFPIVYPVIASFLDNMEIMSGKIFPNKINFDNFTAVFKSVPMARFFFNSVVVSLIRMGGQIIVNSLAAYALVYMSLRNKRAVFMVIVASMFIPADAIFIANFITILNMNILNTFLAIVITGIASGSGIFFMVQNFKKIPYSLIEAARIDGANNFRIYAQIIMPLSKPALATWGVFSFLNAWNAYLWPLMVTTKQDSRVIQVGLKMLISEDASNWGLIMAAIVVIILPSVAAMIFGQKYLQRSMTAGAVKG